MPSSLTKVTQSKGNGESLCVCCTSDTFSPRGTLPHRKEIRQDFPLSNKVSLVWQDVPGIILRGSEVLVAVPLYIYTYCYCFG